MSVESEETLWYQPNLDVFLNRWFPNYEAARRSLESEGGYLLPYRRHFYVCDDGAIRAMGLEPDDPDWERIGRDCARPADAEAYRRLREKRERVRSESKDL
jgi:hypothetical protein